MNTAWITGSNGLIGSHLAQAGVAGWRIVALNRQQLDLTNFEAVRRRFEIESPSFLIHCAAISNSVQCERDPILAHRVNVQSTARLAVLFSQRRMVFFSTDLVFDGRRGCYRETDPPNPLGVYARTKVEAEAAVLTHPQNLVIRTSINGGTSPSGTRGFNEALEGAWKSGKATRLFTDEFRSPIPASVTARATWELIQIGGCGVYHIAGRERLSRLEIGRLIAERHPELNPKIEPGHIKDFHGPARAADCSLDCTKAQAQLSFTLPGLTEWLAANPLEPF